MSIYYYRGYQIKPHPQNPISLIVVTDGKGGKIPSVLEGMYTDRRYAMNVIDKYLESKPNKDKGNGKQSNQEVSTSGD